MSSVNQDLERLPHKAPTWLSWLETLAVTALMILWGAWLSPSDPFFVKTAFCWSTFAPLLTGLRYGFAHGFGCALLLNLCLASAWKWSWVQMTEFPAQLGVGWLAIGMLAGEFSDMWQRRSRRLAVINEYRRTRLDEFARGYHLLKVSHDALEQKVAGTSHNLRESMMTLRRELLDWKQSSNEPLLGIGKRIMNLFATYGWLQVAALFEVKEDQIRPEPIASLGGEFQIKTEDVLIVEAISRKRLISVKRDEGVIESETELLTAIPLVDVQDRLWAVIAVKQMMFIAFQHENLKLLAVLGGHIADIISFGNRLSLGEPTGRTEFVQHLKRHLHDARHFDLPSAVVSLMFTPKRTAEFLAQQILGQRRGLDQAILLKNRMGEIVIFVLLVLTNEMGVEGYLTRLEKLIRERYGTSLSEMGVRIRRTFLEHHKNASAENLFLQLCRGCDVEES